MAIRIFERTVIQNFTFSSVAADSNLENEDVKK